MARARAGAWAPCQPTMPAGHIQARAAASIFFRERGARAASVFGFVPASCVVLQFGV